MELGAWSLEEEEAVSCALFLLLSPCFFPSPSSFSLPLSRLSLIRAFRYRGGEIANKHITSPSYIFSISHRAGIERWRKRQIDKLCILSLPQDRLDSFPSDPRVSNLDRGLPLSALSLLVVTTTLECVGFRQSHEDRRNEGALYLNRCGNWDRSSRSLLVPQEDPLRGR